MQWDHFHQQVCQDFEEVAKQLDQQGNSIPVNKNYLKCHKMHYVCINTNLLPLQEVIELMQPCLIFYFIDSIHPTELGGIGTVCCLWKRKPHSLYLQYFLLKFVKMGQMFSSLNTDIFQVQMTIIDQLQLNKSKDLVSTQVSSITVLICNPSVFFTES